MNNLKELIQRFKSNSILIYCLQIFIALTDFDDHLSIRLRNLAYVCILFFGVSSIPEFLYPYKIQAKLQEIKRMSMQENLSEDLLLVLKQMSLLLETLPELLNLHSQLLKQEIK